MCNLYSITTNQAAIIALFRVVNRYVGNLAPMPGVFPDYKAPIVRNGAEGRELATARWGMPSSQQAPPSPTATIRPTPSTPRILGLGLSEPVKTSRQPQTDRFRLD
jgi:putative SOS response-associated peptidase YedK